MELDDVLQREAALKAQLLREINELIDEKVVRGETARRAWIVTELMVRHLSSGQSEGATFAIRLGMTNFVHEELLRRTDYRNQDNPIDWADVRDRLEGGDWERYLDLLKPWLDADGHRRVAAILADLATEAERHVRALELYCRTREARISGVIHGDKR